MLYVKDQETLLAITYDDIVKYHGRSFIAGAAMGYRLLELAAGAAGGGILVRETFRIILGVNGPGIIDAVEMATRAATRGHLAVEQQIARDKDAPDAADGQGGKYYFKVTCGDRELSVWLRPGFIPPEFLHLAGKTHDGTITAAERARLQQLKEEIAVVLLSRPLQDLFDHE